MMRRLTPWERLEARLPDAFDLRGAGVVLTVAFVAGIAYSLAVPHAASRVPAYAPRDLESLAREVARLESELGAREVESEEQAAELARLRALLAERAAPPVSSGPPDPAAAPPPPRQAIARPIPAPPAEDPGFDSAALIASGVAEEEADRVREAWRRAEASRRELEQRAAAEGWAKSYRHARELRDIDARLRQELDDQGYDGLLYATGRPNRLVVRQVMKDSPAQRAGVRPGDRILRYDGRRVFTSAELYAASLDAKRKPTVLLELERDGERVNVDVPRQPLGVLAKLTRAEPLP